MPLIIATGSNLNDRLDNLKKAKDILSHRFELIEQSNVYYSKAVDYENQPDFYNQVLLFKTPQAPAESVMSELLKIEKDLGRVRTVARGPRTVDIDMLFFDNLEVSTDHLTLPHPRLFDRSFVVLPLMELDFFKELSKHYDFHTNFDNNASVLDLS